MKIPRRRSVASIDIISAACAAMARTATIRIAMLAGAMAVLSSCSSAQGALALLNGNYLLSRGRYAEAIVAYAKTQSSPVLGAYADLALGVSYLALGESGAALQKFFSAHEAAQKLAAQGDGSHAELSYRSWYNSGIARYQLGDFTGAAEDFKQALRIDEGRIGAKRNLELSLQSAIRKGSPAASQAPLEIGSSDGVQRGLFDYIRRKESDRWKSREWTAEASDGPDY
jgi:Ca-activated chloride channel family protein